MQTITVKSWNGEKEVNREQFVEAWTDQLNGLWTICYNQEDHTTAANIRADLERLAGNAFDTLYLEKTAGES